MRYLRMLTNSVIAGALGAAYLTVLVLQLNPHVPLLSATTLSWYVTLGTLYGVHLAVFFYVVLVAREFFSMDVLSPGWASVGVLAWLSAGSAAAIAVLMWLNVRAFEMALTETAGRRMMAGAAATTVCAIILLGIAVAHYSSGRRGSRVGAALLVIAVVGSVSLPIAARGPGVTSPPPVAFAARSGEPLPGPRLVMLLIDGASLEYIWPAAADGRLPNFARLLQQGAVIDLATPRPAAPAALWTSVATGVYPRRTGIRSGAFYVALGDRRPLDLLPAYCFSNALVQLGFVRREVATASDVRVRPLWSILAEAGVSVGVVRWPLTYPAPRIPGFVVSDRFHELLGSMYEFDERVVSPPESLPAVRNAFAVATLEPGGTMPGFDGAGTSADATTLVKDRSYSRALTDLATPSPPRFAALRYLGIDAVGHRYTGDVRPGVFGGSDAARRRAEQALDRYYGFVDAEIGSLLSTLGGDDLLLVTSAFGMQRLNLVKRLAARVLGGEDLTGTHERAPDGFLLAYGSSVQPGRQQRGSIVDVTPTILYFLGLPVGRDMDGYARSDLFRRDFTAGRPIGYVPTYNR
jgi:predicted AlkP superfamily phosphohydrolase/phosphomutase